MECDLCCETFRKSDARETTDGDSVCPDCAESMVECRECELLFCPEDEEELCPHCQEDEDEGEEDTGPPAKVDDLLRQDARVVPESMARSLFYQRQQGPDERLDDALPRLRAEVVAELAAMDDAALTEWARRSWWGPPGPEIRQVDRGSRPPDDELARRVDVFTAELRRAIGELED